MSTTTTRLLFLIILCTTRYALLWGDNSTYTTYEKTDQLIGKLRINNSTVHCDTLTGRCLVSIPKQRADKHKPLFAKISANDITAHEIRINGQLIGEKKTTLTPADTYTIRITRADGTQSQYSLETTTLPVVSLQMDACNSETFQEGTFTLTAPEYQSEAQHHSALFRWRGSSSLNYQKKSFAIKLIDKNHEKTDASFLGMRSDNSWILDAMAIDKARMRNRVSTDLWNDFAAESVIKQWEPDMTNGTHGHFVEVFLNGQYQGLYCFTEKLDRKQLQLKKTRLGNVYGALYKSKYWNNSVGMWQCPSSYDNHATMWEGWELQYPDYTEDEPIDWAPLYNAIDFVAKSNGTQFVKEVENWFDLDVWRDYFLYMNLLFAPDNMGKNMYLYVYDATITRQIGVAPWDMDATWGRLWEADACPADTNFYNTSHNLHDRLRKEMPHYDRETAERYADLRETFFATDAIQQRFDTYFALFNESGAGQRETARWSGTDNIELDFANEAAYIRQWVEQRLQYLDQVFGYTHTGIDTPGNDQSQLQLRTSKNTLSLQADNNCTATIHTLSGILVTSIQLTAKTPVTVSLSAGVYVVNRKKVLVP